MRPEKGEPRTPPTRWKKEDVGEKEDVGRSKPWVARIPVPHGNLLLRTNQPSRVLTKINPTAARSNKSSRLLVRLPLPVIPSLASRPNPVPPATATPSPVTSHDPRASPSPAPPGSDRGAGPRGGACPDGRDNRRGAGSGGVSQDEQTATESREILEVVVTEEVRRRTERLN